MEILYIPRPEGAGLIKNNRVLLVCAALSRLIRKSTLTDCIQDSDLITPGATWRLNFTPRCRSRSQGCLVVVGFYFGYWNNCVSFITDSRGVDS